MGLRLHDYHNLGSVEGNLVEGQRQGLNDAGFTQSRGLMERLKARGPGQRLCGGGVRGGGGRRGFNGGVRCGVLEHFLQVGFSLLQLGQRGVDFEGARQFHIQLSCGGR